MPGTPGEVHDSGGDSTSQEEGSDQAAGPSGTAGGRIEVESSGDTVSTARGGTTGLERMNEDMVIPVYEGKPPKKLVPFEVEKLDRTNVRGWKNKYKTFLELQDCWDAVQLTLNWQDQPGMIERLFKQKGWKAADAAARLYIL